MIWFVLLWCIWFENLSSSQKIGKSLDLKFETLALGHSGILVSWDPSKEPNPSNVKYHFYYQLLINSTTARRKDTYSTSDVDEGQTKISNLEENSKYQIIVERREKRERSTEYIIESKTGVKSNTKPAKPDFTYTTKLQYDHTLVAIIIWLPCGKDRNCKGGIAGTHFLVNYRVKNSKQFVEIPYTASDRFRIQDLFAGKTYEIKVISVNGALQTESDPQEINIPPTTGPVKSVKVLPLSNTEFFFTWNKPQDVKIPIKDYRIKYGKTTGDLLHENNFFKSKFTDSTQAKISKLSPNTNYTFFIIPRTESGIGAEFKVDLTPKASAENSLPLAKPEFTYNIEELKDSLPKIKIRWYPCGQLKECTNTRPGSAFQVKYKSNKSPYYNTVAEFDNDYVLIHDAIPGQSYEFMVSSVDKSETITSDKMNIHIPQSDPLITVVEAVEGQVISLTCKLPRSSKPDIHWYLDGKSIKYDDEIQKLENGDLRISKPAINTKEFKCSDHSQSNKANATIFLVIKSKTLIENKKDFGIRQLSLGEKVNLICQVKKEHFTGVEVKWLKDGKDQGGKIRDLVSPFQISKELPISIDNEQRFGNYTCVAKSHLDEDQASVSLVKKK